MGAEDFPSSRIVFPTRPAPDAMSALDMPVLVVLPTRSRHNHPNRTARSATELLPGATVVPLLGHSHHSIPAESPGQLNSMLVGFLGTERDRVAAQVRLWDGSAGSGVQPLGGMLWLELNTLVGSHTSLSRTRRSYFCSP